MAAKDASGYSLKLAGPGVTFDRPISEEIANRIINLVMTGSLAAPALPPGTPGSVPLGTPAQNPGQLAGTTIKQFIAQKRPGNMYQRVACLAYYLTHVSQTPHFKTKEIFQANTDAALPKLTNATQSVANATKKYDYLSEVGGGKKQISAFGESVVAVLPDQEKVKQLHAENKPRKKSTRKKKPR